MTSDKIITDYAVATETDLATLRTAMKAYFRDGWQPLGELKIVISSDGTIKYFQVIVKY